MKYYYIIFSFLLSTLILFNSLQVSITYAYYELDPVGFIEKLCENKDKPELKCNGKCHLKKVAENSSNDNKNLPNIIDFKDILLYKESSAKYITIRDLEKVYQNYGYKNFYTYLKFTDCFHPPENHSHYNSF